MGEKHQLVASSMLPDWGLSWQPRHVPCLGIELVTSTVQEGAEPSNAGQREAESVLPAPCMPTA